MKLDELSQGTPACGARRALHARIFQTGIKKVVDGHAFSAARTRFTCLRCTLPSALSRRTASTLGQKGGFASFG
ncbi:MAG: hypothetical protein DMG08_02340 [Acidobacteria bacterium]|nr:MAG: hypothetical protein DMG08_02340 [Acidobacteriota bacterium]